jgi:hypothetical protein
MSKALSVDCAHVAPGLVAWVLFLPGRMPPHLASVCPHGFSSVIGKVLQVQGRGKGAASVKLGLYDRLIALSCLHCTSSEMVLRYC